MLTFEQKLAIIESFPELQRKNVSLGRVNFQLKESKSDKKNIIYHLHPNGNGYVYVGNLKNDYSDEKGMVNIRNFSEKELDHIIRESISSLSPIEIPIPEPEINMVIQEERWINNENTQLLLINEDETWNLYFGLNLEDTFGTYEEAEMFLVDEGFRRL